MPVRRRLLHESRTKQRIDQFWLAIPESGTPVVIHDYVKGTHRGEQFLGVPQFLLAHRGAAADALLSLIATLVPDDGAQPELLPWPKS
jgi:hypothetical protein